jgi:hypothetical protein
MARNELGFLRFVRRDGFRRRQTGSTMWLARAVEHMAALSVYGQWDGLPVTVDRPRPVYFAPPCVPFPAAQARRPSS